MKRWKNSKTLFYGSFVVIAILFLVSNLSQAGKGKMQKLNFENVILDYEKTVGEADYFFNVLEWNAYLHSDDEGLASLLNIYENKKNEIINDEDNFKEIKALRDNYIKKNVRGKKREIVEKWYSYLNKLIVLDSKAKKLQKDEVVLKNKVSKSWNLYRPKMKDKKGKYIKDKNTSKVKLFNNSEIKRILYESKYRDERRRAFEAQSQVGFELQKAGFKKLIKLRNEFARARGYKDFYNMKYTYAGYDEDRIFKMFDKIVMETESTAKTAVGGFLKKYNYKKFEPWDADYAFMGFSKYIDKHLTKEGMVGALEDSFKNLGIDLDKLSVKMDLEPRPGKFPHAACWWLSFADYTRGRWTGEDIRLMANLDKGGLDHYDTLFHETGHAVHGATIKQKYVIDKNVNLTYLYDMGGLVEGIAFVFQKIPYEKEWFLKYADFGKKKTKEDINKLKKAFSQYKKNAKPWEAFFIRNLLVKVYFEREIYKNPDADFNKIWWDKMQKLLFVERYENLPHWSHKMHFISHPAYYQFYVMADLISEQIVHHFRKKYGKVFDNPRIGKDMISKLFVPGNSIHWEKMLENLTGEKLNPQYRIDAVTKF